MIFEKHLNLKGLHSAFSPSQSSWLRYDDDKVIEVYQNKKAAEMGTRLHEWAKTTIDLGIKQPRSKKTIYAYVNDAIGYSFGYRRANVRKFLKRGVELSRKRCNCGPCKIFVFRNRRKHKLYFIRFLFHF